MFYRNITIEDNVIYNAHVHGITVGETHGLTIKNNTILRNQAAGDDKLVHVPRINLSEKSTDVVVANNLIAMVGNPKLTLPSKTNATWIRTIFSSSATARVSLIIMGVYSSMPWPMATPRSTTLEGCRAG